MIAWVILYECCVAAETVLGMSQVVGNLGTRVRVMEEARSVVHNLRCARRKPTCVDSGGSKRRNTWVQAPEPEYSALRYSPGFAGHSFRNIFPALSLASTAKVAAPVAR